MYRIYHIHKENNDKNLINQNPWFSIYQLCLTGTFDGVNKAKNAVMCLDAALAAQNIRSLFYFYSIYEKPPLNIWPFFAGVGWSWKITSMYCLDIEFGGRSTRVWQHISFTRFLNLVRNVWWIFILNEVICIRFNI